MPHQQALATRAPEGLSPPEKCPQGRLADAVSAASLSFVACGAAVADLGELLRELRLALHIAGPPDPSEARDAALLAARLETVRRALHETTAAVGALLEDCVPSADVRSPASLTSSDRPIATAVVGDQTDSGGSPPLASNAANSGRLIAVTPSRTG